MEEFGGEGARKRVHGVLLFGSEVGETPGGAG